METLGSRLKAIRLEHNLSQAETAKIIDKTVRTYQRYESDERLPNVYDGLKLSQYYGIPFEELFKLVDK